MDCCLVIGLGNPGDKYARTRHNAGFMTIDSCRKIFHTTSWRTGRLYMYSTATIRNERLVFIKPLTFMNASGLAVKQAAQKYEVSPENMIVVHDDLDLECGRIKVKIGGGTGGHKGLESIVASIMSDRFARIRIGIGRPSKSEEVTDYVLEVFDSCEDSILFSQGLETAIQALETMIFDGAVSAMNRYNRTDKQILSEENQQESDDSRPVSERGN